jgi:SAM-dependent methyltransferase
MHNEAQKQYFEGLLEQHGANHLGLDWNSRESQKLRFQIFKEIFVHNKKNCNISVLDLGCGFGDFFGFLKAEGLLRRHKISYVGYDISPKIIEAAKNKYRDAKFEVKDILAERYLPEFDYVFCSGIFNIRALDSSGHLEFVKSMLLRVYDLARQGVAVNFLSEGALPVSYSEDVNLSRYFFFKPEQILSFVRFFCSRYILRHDYHLGDFTLYLFK